MSTLWFVIHWLLLFSYSDIPTAFYSIEHKTKQKKIEHLFHAPHHVTQSTITTKHTDSGDDDIRQNWKSFWKKDQSCKKKSRVQRKRKERRRRRNTSKKDEKAIRLLTVSISRSDDDDEKKGWLKQASSYRGRLSAWINESERKREERRKERSRA